MQVECVCGALVEEELGAGGMCMWSTGGRGIRCRWNVYVEFGQA